VGERGVAAVLCILALQGGGPAVAADFGERPTLTTEAVVAAAQAALAACRSSGHPAVVTVVDRSGALRLLLADEDASPLSVELSRRKAHTAIVTKAPSATLAARGQAAPRMMQALSAIDPQLAFAGGGLPILHKGRLAGAIAVSGAPNGDADVLCAQAGLQRLAP
jgi:uncharacterized protein GlcG (DUF336 family)